MLAMRVGIWLLAVGGLSGNPLSHPRSFQRSHHPGHHNGSADDSVDRAAGVLKIGSDVLQALLSLS